jgi:FAD/FMN-containing dehydrogenase
MKPGSFPPSAETLARFAAIAGQQYTISEEAEMVPYLREWRDRYQGRAALILRPGSVEDVSRILALASETGTAIVPQGGNTGLVGGQIPFESGNEVVLSLARLNRVRETDVIGHTLTVEAGMTLAQVQQEADAAGTLFPLSLASEGSCQIGGNLATNAGGMQVLSYGNARDLVLGLEVVLASGEVWNGLKTLRKDNTGYDLRDLFIGSEGTLGIITAAALKLFPRPRQRATLFAGLPDLDGVLRFLGLAKMKAGPALTLFELLPRIGLEFVLRHGQGVRDPLMEAHPWYVLAEISSLSEDGEAGAAMASIAESAFESGCISDAVIAATLAQREALLKLRELMSEMQKYEGGSIKHDISVPVARIPDFIREAGMAVERLVPGARPVPFGHAGDGNIHYNVSQPVGMDTDTFLAQWEEMADAVHGIVTRMHGSISAEHGIGRMKRDVLLQVKSPVEIELMRRIKSAFDPRGILNPGKML